MTVIDSAQELLASAAPQLRNIYPHNLSISIRPVGPDENIDPNEPKAELSFLTRRVENQLHFRLIVELAGHEYEALADYVAEYDVPPGVEVSDFAAAEFFDRCVHATLYPYVRAALSDLTSRLPVRTVTLPIFIPGSVVFATREDYSKVDDQ